MPAKAQKSGVDKSGAPRPQPRYLYSRCLTPWGLFWRERWRPEIVSQGAITPMGRQSATVFASLSLVGRMHNPASEFLFCSLKLANRKAAGESSKTASRAQNPVLKQN